MTDSPQRFGYVAIVGEPNAGKSTLMNALLKTKLSIVTPKVQTTRFRIQGIYVENNAQLVMVDTPGLFTAKSDFEKSMVHAASEGFYDADLVVLLFDLRKDLKLDLEQFFASKKNKKLRKIYVLNKTDLVKPEIVQKAYQQIMEIDPKAEIQAISALNGQGVDELRGKLLESLPEGPWMFPDDQLTDISERLLAAEVTREQIFLQLSQEVPYGVYVETEQWENFRNGSVKISQAVIIARDSHKPIVLGQGGSRIKAIRTAAQAEMEKIFDRSVHLFLHIKIREDWASNKYYLKEMGLSHKP